MSINSIYLADSADKFSFLAYPVKGTAFSCNGQTYLDKHLSASLLCYGTFERLAPLVEAHSDIYVIQGVECLPDSFLFGMFISGRCKLFGAIAERLYDHSFQNALASFMTPVS